MFTISRICTLFPCMMLVASYLSVFSQVYVVAAVSYSCFFFFFNDTAPTEISPLSLPDALPISFKPLRATRLLELPLHVMDTALFFPSHLNLSAKEAGKLVRAIIENVPRFGGVVTVNWRSEEHTSELQSRLHLVCRLLLEKKNE